MAKGGGKGVGSRTALGLPSVKAMQAKLDAANTKVAVAEAKTDGARAKALTVKAKIEATGTLRVDTDWSTGEQKVVKR